MTPSPTVCCLVWRAGWVAVRGPRPRLPTQRRQRVVSAVDRRPRIPTFRAFIPTQRSGRKFLPGIPEIPPFSFFYLGFLAFSRFCNSLTDKAQATSEQTPKRSDPKYRRSKVNPTPDLGPGSWMESAGGAWSCTVPSSRRQPASRGRVSCSPRHTLDTHTARTRPGSTPTGHAAAGPPPAATRGISRWTSSPARLTPRFRAVRSE